MLEHLTYHVYPDVRGDAFECCASDTAILRELMKRFAEAAAHERNAELRALWRAHNHLAAPRPLVAVWAENWLEVPEVCNLQCQSEAARGLEFRLRQLLWQWHNVPDDKPLEATLSVRKVAHWSDWGLPVLRNQHGGEGDAWGFVPVINTMEDALKLHSPTIEYDEAASLKKLDRVRELFGDILPVRLSGVQEISYHICMQYSDWRGLQNLYTDFYDEPEMLAHIMDKLKEGYQSILRQMEEQELLDLNNDGTYQGTGGLGYTDELPGPGFTGHVRPCDMWGSAEAQELAQVSPRMHREHLFVREAELLRPFGLTEYGCCEPLHDKLDDVLALPGIRKISASPWADIGKYADKVGRKAITSWKPNPAWLSDGHDEAWVQRQLDEGVRTLKDCAFEVLLEDLRTCSGKPERIGQWVRMVRQALRNSGFAAI